MKCSTVLMLNSRVSVRVKYMSNINSRTKIFVTKKFFLYVRGDDKQSSSEKVKIYKQRQNCLCKEKTFIYWIMVHGTRISEENHTFFLLL